MKYKIVYSKDYIAIMKDKKELLGWHEDEWKEDSQVVFFICNAIELAYKNELNERLKL
jgi:hypothetical protein